MGSGRLFTSSHSATQRRIVVVATVLLCMAGGIWLGSLWGAAPFIRSVYDGELLPYLGDLLRTHAANNPEHEGIEFYVQLAKGAARRLFLLAVVFWGFVVWVTDRRPSLLTDYFSEKGSPLTLAVFRIVVFGLLLSGLHGAEILESAHHAQDLRISPPLMGWLFDHVPLGEAWVRSAVRLMQGACVLAIVGFFSRTAAWTAGLLGVYVLGIPELLGKINHGHHQLIWFALLLGTSRCGDALSVDVLLRAYRYPDDPEEARPAPSPTYGRPLRWAWLLIGLIYFFPGLWKFILSGGDWVVGENLKFKMYARWHQLQMVPALRIDRIPLLYQGLAAGTILFEMGFIVAILFRRWRPYAVIGGLSFHLGVAYFMRIIFRTLLWCYVVFVPWGWVCRWMGRRLFGRPLVVRYDRSDGMLKRLVAVVRAGDWFRALRYEPTDIQDISHVIVAYRDGSTWWGGVAFAHVLLRVPLLWPLAPVLALVFWARDVSSGGRQASKGESRTDGRAVTLVGGALFGINVLFGLFLINSWPFSVYPTHAGVSGEYRSDVEMMVTTTAGDTIDAERALDLPPSRRQGLGRTVLAAPDSARRVQLLKQLSDVVRNGLPDRVAAQSIDVYRVKESKVPEQWAKNPVERTLVVRLPLRTDGAS